MKNEVCPRCKSPEFSVARNMIGTRKCKCGNSWLPKASALTKWEAGNELVKVADALHAANEELKDYPELKEAVGDALKIIQKAFSDAKLEDEMKFGI